MPKRNKDLQRKRDEKIFSRYIYWTETQRLRFDDTLRRLSQDEFFLEENTILKIIKRGLAKAEEEGHPIPRQRYLAINI